MLKTSPLPRITIALLAAGLPLTRAISLDTANGASIANASSTLAFGVQSWYHNNASDTAATAVGTFPPPYYWWEAGAVWGGMIDYWAYTQDPSYISVVHQALLAQTGPENNYEPPAYHSSLGNDDQAFWGMALLSAIEYGFPVPPGKPSSLWYDLAVNVWNSQAARWDLTSCNGGLHWQIYSDNAGYSYKNSISNGALFQMSARLARYTGNQTYVDWAVKAWDWMSAVRLISDDYMVFDGTDDTINCSQVDHTVWSYNPAVLLYGTAMLYNLTNGTQLWADRSTGLLTNMNATFFSPFGNASQPSNASGVAYEWACEPQNNCNYDQYSFKAYLARWMAKASVVMPSIAPAVEGLLTSSAKAAAQSCSGGDNGQTCGAKWYVAGYDGNYGLGQELSAMETVQSLLLLHAPIAPQHQSSVGIETNAPITSTFSPTVAPRTATQTAPQSKATSSSSANPGSRAAWYASPAGFGTSLSLLALMGGLGFVPW